MTFRNYSASYLAAVVFFAGLATFTTTASADDPMQLDIDFRNSLSQGHTPAAQQEAEGRHLRQQPVLAAKRHPRRHNQPR
jgi:hypothetical protein